MFYHLFDKLKYLTISFWPIILGILIIVIVFMIKNKKEVHVKIYHQSNNCRIPISCELIDISTKGENYPNYFIDKYYEIKVYGYK